jgi:hypothetical protein
MTRIWKISLFVLVAAYFVVDGLFSFVTRPITVWIGKMHIFERARRWVVSLRPYPSLALFAVPLIILEPVKPVAGSFSVPVERTDFHVLPTRKPPCGLQHFFVCRERKLVSREQCRKLIEQNFAAGGNQSTWECVTAAALALSKTG